MSDEPEVKFPEQASDLNVATPALTTITDPKPESATEKRGENKGPLPAPKSPLSKKTIYHCKKCLHTHPVWSGRCLGCGAYQTMTPGASPSKSNFSGDPKVISEIEISKEHRVPSGTREFDRVLSGGLVEGGVVLIAGEPGKGKLQSLKSRILTPKGWSTMGDMKAGEFVIGSNGRPTRVASVHPQGDVQLYRVKLSDGGETLCGAEHLWLTRNRRERLTGKFGKVRTTREIMDTIYRSDGGLMHSIPFVKPVHFKASKKLPLHPYVLGTYLADGSMMEGSVTITKPETDIIDRIASMLPAGDEIVSVSKERAGISWRIRKMKSGPARSKTAQALMELELSGKTGAHKFVPREYLFASIEDRLWLLRGLIDGDGHVSSCSSGTTIEYATISDRLAKDCAELVLSLGGRVTTKGRQTTYTHKDEKKLGQPSYRLRLSFHDSSVVPVASEKHTARFRHVTRLTERFIQSVQAESIEAAQCITVEAPDGLYVTDDYIVTHNSTLALQVGCALADASFDPCRVLYVSGEETESQIKERAERIALDKPKNMILVSEVDIEKIEEHIRKYDPDVMFIDSIQTMRYGDGRAGSVTVVQDVTSMLVNISKARSMSTVIIGHVNSDGDIAGPKALEHLVDTVLSFDEERSSEIRTLRCLKNRFGSTTEVGIFRMHKGGLSSVDDASEHLLRGKRGAPGSSLACAMIRPGRGSGTRAMLVEVQALFSNPSRSPKHVVAGYSKTRLDMIIAIMENRTQMFGPQGDDPEHDIRLGGLDLYLNVAGGFEIEEAALDLPVALAIASARMNVPLPTGTVAWGELGLTGEVRPESGYEERLKVCQALGFKHTIASQMGEEIMTINDALDGFYKMVEKVRPDNDPLAGEEGESREDDEDEDEDEDGREDGDEKESGDEKEGDDDDEKRENDDDDPEIEGD